jgi:hypothetical protein
VISTFTAFFDSNVFFGARLRSLILSLAKTGLFRARWSEYVHEEWIRAVLSKRSDLNADSLAATRAAMDRAVPDCLVAGYEELANSLNLPDAGDRPILAAAICANASAIVTFNDRDFPSGILAKFGLHTRHPDEFILDIASIGEIAFLAAVKWDFEHYRNPPIAIDDYLGGLERSGAPMTAAYLAARKVLLEDDAALE